MKLISRKGFISKSLLTATGLIVAPNLIRAVPKQQGPGPQLSQDLVKEWLIAAHVDPAKNMKMLEETPDFLNAVYNIGAWDWEDALGAAGHMGHKDLARHLLSKGARMTICVAAMLGELNVVKSMITAFPYMKDTVGPHKISLLTHAKTGGEPALPVVDYLKSLGVTK